MIYKHNFKLTIYQCKRNLRGKVIIIIIEVNNCVVIQMVMKCYLEYSILN